jgi:hypothetical protein
MDKFIKKKSNLKARICISLSWASFRLRYCRIGVLFIPNHVQEVEAHVQLLRYQDIQNHSKQIRKIENQMERKNKIPISSPEIQLIKPLWNPDQGSTAKTKLYYMMRWENWLIQNQVSKLWEKPNLTSLIHSTSAALTLEEHRQMLKLHKVKAKVLNTLQVLNTLLKSLNLLTIISSKGSNFSIIKINSRAFTTRNWTARKLWAPACHLQAWPTLCNICRRGSPKRQVRRR